MVNAERQLYEACLRNNNRWISFEDWKEFMAGDLAQIDREEAKQEARSRYISLKETWLITMGHKQVGNRDFIDAQRSCIMPLFMLSFIAMYQRGMVGLGTTFEWSLFAAGIIGLIDTIVYRVSKQRAEIHAKRKLISIMELCIVSMEKEMLAMRERYLQELDKWHTGKYNDVLGIRQKLKAMERALLKKAKSITMGNIVAVGTNIREFLFAEMARVKFAHPRGVKGMEKYLGNMAVAKLRQITEHLGCTEDDVNTKTEDWRTWYRMDIKKGLIVRRHKGNIHLISHDQKEGHVVKEVAAVRAVICIMLYNAIKYQEIVRVESDVLGDIDLGSILEDLIQNKWDLERLETVIGSIETVI